MNPLLTNDLEIYERLRMQRELFEVSKRGTRLSRVSSLSKFYTFCWDNLPHVCEETGQHLHNYSAVYISHILSRGAHPEMSLDPRNVNILSFPAHQQWEIGKRTEMRIYEKNQIRIQILKDDYNSLSLRKR